MVDLRGITKKKKRAVRYGIRKDGHTQHCSHKCRLLLLLHDGCTHISNAKFHRHTHLSLYCLRQGFLHTVSQISLQLYFCVFFTISAEQVQTSVWWCVWERSTSDSLWTCTQSGHFRNCLEWLSSDLFEKSTEYRRAVIQDGHVATIRVLSVLTLSFRIPLELVILYYLIFAKEIWCIFDWAKSNPHC